MAVPLTLLAFVFAFAGASSFAARMSAGTRWIPHVVLAALAFVLFFELTRYDHGHTDVLFWIGFIVAPVVTIFGGAAWGSRRLYGWPDAGPAPSRAALVAAAVLVGVLTGSEQKMRDVAATESVLAAWVTDGRRGAPPSTKLGFIAPPVAVQGRAPDTDSEVVAFPVGNGRWRILDVNTRQWRTSEEAPR